MGLLVLATAAALVSYLIVLSIYRLTLHPLARYPGPKLAAITNWYATFYIWRGDMHTTHRAWHAQYGDTVRAGPNTLYFNNPSDMAGVYSVGANVRKPDAWVAFSPSRRSGNILSTVDKTVHAFKRRTIGPVFSDRGLQQLESRIIGKVERFTALLQVSDEVVPKPAQENQDSEKGQGNDGWGLEQDMALLCERLAFDVISDIVYGKGLDMLETPGMRWITDAYTAMSRRSSMPKLYEWKLDQIFLSAAYRDIMRTGTYTYNRVKDRVAQGRKETNRDLFDSLMEAQDHKRGLEYRTKDLWIESMLLLTAGADTTSTTMSAAIFYLLHNPAALARAISEVRQTFKTADEIQRITQINDCNFLQACINEALRLAPAVPLASLRIVEKGGLTLGYEHIPEGTIVGTSLYTMQRNPEYFDQPNSFRPERWLVNPDTGVTEESVNLAHKAFAPFGIGPRQCVGWRLGWLELNVTLARTLFLYDMRLGPGAACCSRRASGDDCEYSTKAWSVMAGEGPVVQFRRAGPGSV